jgi:DNA polymerase-3 subunit epsilon
MKKFFNENFIDIKGLEVPKVEVSKLDDENLEKLFDLTFPKLDKAPEGSKVLVTFDLETTGTKLSTTDEIIELAMVKLCFDENFKFLGQLGTLHRYNDPGMPISEFITELTGIDDEMVAGHKIDNQEVKDFLKDVDFIIAHNMSFDKQGFKKMGFTKDEVPTCLCSYEDGPWTEFINHKQESLMTYHGVEFIGHKAINDVKALSLLLTMKDYLKVMIERGLKDKVYLFLVGLQYDVKDVAKEAIRPVWYNDNKVWYKKVCVDEVEETLETLNKAIKDSGYMKSKRPYSLQKFHAPPVYNFVDKIDGMLSKIYRNSRLVRE